VTSCRLPGRCTRGDGDVISGGDARNAAAQESRGILTRRGPNSLFLPLSHGLDSERGRETAEEHEKFDLADREKTLTDM
jgi:hypothetical protein